MGFVFEPSFIDDDPGPRLVSKTRLEDHLEKLDHPLISWLHAKHHLSPIEVAPIHLFIGGYPEKHVIGIAALLGDSRDVLGAFYFEPFANEVGLAAARFRRSPRYTHMLAVFPFFECRSWTGFSGDGLARERHGGRRSRRFGRGR